MRTILSILLVLLGCGSVQVRAQQSLMPQFKADQESEAPSRLDLIDLTNIELPPIAVFLDAAHSYADIRFFNSQIEEQELLLKQTRRDWLSYIKLQGTYQYGTNNSFQSQSGEQLPPQYGYTTTRTQNWYNAGAGISIPLNDLLGRKNKSNIIRSRVQQAEFEAEKALESRQITILECYNEVVKQLSILKVKAEAVALYEAQMEISEKDFANGRIDIISLSLERSRRAGAQVSYQESRAALHNAVTILEMLTKIKIIKN